MAEVVDLLDDSDEELALPLAARLAAATKAPARPQTSQERAPLAAVHNQQDSSGAAAPPAAAPPAASGRPNSPTLRPSLPAATSLGGADVLRQRQAERAARKAARAAAAAAEGLGSDSLPGMAAAADPDPRPQYHQQEQRIEEQQSEAALGGSQQPARRGPTRGAGSGRHQQQPAAREPLFGSEASLEPYSQQQGLLDAAHDDCQPPASIQGAKRRGGAAAAAAAAAVGGAGGGGGEPPAKKGGRRPKRTAEEIARDKAIQAREREERKQLRQEDQKKYALKRVKLVVDAALINSSGGSGGSLGIGMLNHLDEYNRKLAPSVVEEKRINYAVEPLDLAPFKALRWQRRRLLAGSQAAGASQQLLDSQASFAAGGEGLPPTQLQEQWDEEPHVMVCFQPQEFIDAVRRDRLASLFSLLERRAAGQRPYILVCGLARHIEAQERKQHRSDMRAGPMAAVQQSVKPLVDEFLAGLHVECPRLGFRDVVDEAQAAQHVQLITAAIAQEANRDSDATVFLRAHSKNESTAMQNMVIRTQLDESLRPFARSIFALPAVQPGTAHVLAGYYGSLGGLMDMLLDPSRSDGDKEAEIKEMTRTAVSNGTSGMRVGPAAAKQLLQLLRSTDPNLRISSKEAAD